jgi:hypothetical protein
MINEPNSKQVRLSVSQKIQLIDFVNVGHSKKEAEDKLNVTGEVLQAKTWQFRDRIINQHGEQVDADIRDFLVSFKASNGWLQKIIYSDGGQEAVVGVASSTWLIKNLSTIV